LGKVHNHYKVELNCGRRDCPESRN